MSQLPFKLGLDVLTHPDRNRRTDGIQRIFAEYVSLVLQCIAALFIIFSGSCNENRKTLGTPHYCGYRRSRIERSPSHFDCSLVRFAIEHTKTIQMFSAFEAGNQPRDQPFRFRIGPILPVPHRLEYIGRSNP